MDLVTDILFAIAFVAWLGWGQWIAIQRIRQLRNRGRR